MLVSERKARLRLAERTRWRECGPTPERARRSDMTQDRFLSAFPPIPGRRIALYASSRGEVGTERIRARCLAAGALLHYPRAEDGGDLVFYRHREGDGWVRGRFGIREPVVPSGSSGLRDGFDLVVVPGLAFDALGRRLGQGHGYYDRFLSGLAEGTVRIGLAYGWQLVPEVPVEPWDVPVDVVVTDEGVIRVSRGIFADA